MQVGGIVTRKDHSSDSSDFRGPSAYSSYPKGSSQGFADKSSTLGSQLHVDLQSKDGDPMVETQSILQKNGLPIHQILLSPSALTIHVDASDTGWGVHSQIVSKAGCWAEREKQESINVRELKQTQPEQRREDIIAIDSSDDEQNQSAPTTTVNNTVINNDSSDSEEEPMIDDFDDIVDSDAAGLPSSSFWSRTIRVPMKTIHNMMETCRDIDSANRYLRNEGAFWGADTPMFCRGGSRMHLLSSSNRWRCHGIMQQDGMPCCKGSSRAATSGSFFFKRHITSNNILLILYFWAIKTPRTTISLAIGSQYTSEVINDFYRMIYCDLNQNDTKIGGPGIIVEIDESNFGKRKYHRGHRVEVENRTAITLEAIIREHVLPGSIVHTDCWRAYSRIPQIVSGSQHRTVNHSREYITVDTNTIEGTWAGVKCNIAVRLRNRKMMPWMLVDFIWRRKHHGDIWGGIMKCMREVEFSRDNSFVPHLTEFTLDADSEEDE